jgi:hypothetical protein
MKPIRDCIGRALRWTQPRVFKREYELRAGGDLLATLGYEGFLGRAARAEAAEGVWTLNQAGFPVSRTVVRREGSDVELAAYSRRWRGGTLEFAGGRVFTSKSLRFWPPEWGFTDREGHVLVRFRSEWNPFKASARVVIERRADGLEELPLLLLVGWHAAILARRARHRSGG